jgi:hypothetical protein
MVDLQELQRINTFISKMADDKFTRIDVQRTGQVCAEGKGAQSLHVLKPSCAGHSLVGLWSDEAPEVK